MKLKALIDYSNDRLDRTVGMVVVKAGESFEVADELGAWLLRDAPEGFEEVKAIEGPPANKMVDAPKVKK